MITLTQAKLLRIPVLFIAFLLLCGCTTIPLYTPTPQHISMHDEKGDFSASAGIGSNSDVSKFSHFSASYSVADQLNLMSAASFTYSLRESVGIGHSIQWELGLGYYGNFINEVWRYELLAGYGRGYVNTATADTAMQYNLNKYFLQPSFGFKKDIISMAFSCRTSILQFKNFSAHEGLGNNVSAFHMVPLGYPESQFVIEPTITIQLGYENIRFQAQYGWSDNFTVPYFPQGRQFMHVGLFLSFPTQKSPEAPANTR